MGRVRGQPGNGAGAGAGAGVSLGLEQGTAWEWGWGQAGGRGRVGGQPGAGPSGQEASESGSCSLTWCRKGKMWGRGSLRTVCRMVLSLLTLSTSWSRAGSLLWTA